MGELRLITLRFGGSHPVPLLPSRRLIIEAIGQPNRAEKPPRIYGLVAGGLLLRPGNGFEGVSKTT